MILLTTHEARMLHAFIVYGAASETDRAHLESAKAKLQSHTAALVEMMAVSSPKPKPKEPA